MRQNFANSDRYTNEDAEIILIGHKPRFCIHRPGMEGVLRGGSVRGMSIRTGPGAFVDTTVIDCCRPVSTCGTDANWGDIGVDFKRLLVACTLLQTDHIIL